jgi:hypothetical protein
MAKWRQDIGSTGRVWEFARMKMRAGTATGVRGDMLVRDRPGPQRASAMVVRGGRRCDHGVMPRLARAVTVLFVLVCLLDCRKAVMPTPNGNEIGSWKLPDKEGKQTGEYTEVLDLPFGDKVEVHYTVGTLDLGGTTVTAPLTARVKVVESAGLDVQVGFDQFVMHVAGDPPEQRTLDARVTSTRDTSGCTGTSFQSDSSILRLTPQGKIVRVAPEAPAPAQPAKQ